MRMPDKALSHETETDSRLFPIFPSPDIRNPDLCLGNSARQLRWASSGKHFRALRVDHFILKRNISQWKPNTTKSLVAKFALAGPRAELRQPTLIAGCCSIWRRSQVENQTTKGSFVLDTGAKINFLSFCSVDQQEITEYEPTNARCEPSSCWYW